MIEVGRVVIKLKGRDAGTLGVITEIIDENFVKIITLKRKKARKCNVRHISPLKRVINIEGKSEEEIIKELENLNI
jgi:large subunit ribosomal protein L14e